MELAFADTDDGIGDKDARVTDDTAPPPRKRGRAGWLALLAILLVGVAGWRGWDWWQARDARAQDAVDASELRIEALEARTDTARREQRLQAQSLQDLAASHRILREEILGLSQRGALLEEAVARLASTERGALATLRLEEVALLLAQASQRLDIAGDVDGAGRAYALAAEHLAAIDDPALLDLKQTLTQERAALAAYAPGPRAELDARLQAFSSALQSLPERAATAPAQRPAWQRMLAPLVDIRPSQRAMVIAPADRGAGLAALQIELGLARAALERRDETGLRAALTRVQAWLPRLWPDSPALRQRQAELEALRQVSLRSQPPELGSTLRQLHDLRGGGGRSEP